MNNEYVLEMNHITKKYGDNRVLNDVTLNVKPGEILALIGENGAGKSTIMNILFGMPVIRMTGGFEGEIRFNGQPVSISSPIEAAKLGIGMVHQEFMLIDNFTVAENVKLNREIGVKTLVSRVLGREQELIDRKATERECKKTLDSLGVSLDAATRIKSLPVGYKQFVEIARELDKDNIRLLVLDEPTAVLSEQEADIFLDCVRGVAERGVAVIFISHRLEEIKKATQRLYILKDGEMVGEYATKDISVVRMSELMVGREVEIMAAKSVESDGNVRPIIQLKNFSVDMPGEQVQGIDLDIYEGEILGIGGLSGHGKVGIANGVMGICPSEGEVFFDGKPLDVENTTQTLKNGIVFVSEDRRGSGLLLDRDIALNITVESLYIQKKFMKRFLGVPVQDTKASIEYANQMIKELDIRCTGYKQHVERLSGGNQQEVCMARALAMHPRVLFVSEPTRGIDIGAKKMILDYLLRLNQEEGVTIVITSSELAEIRSISNRIAIVTEGKIAGFLKPEDEDYKFGMLMSGITDFEEREGE